MNLSIFLPKTLYIFMESRTGRKCVWWLSFESYMVGMETSIILYLPADSTSISISNSKRSPLTFKSFSMKLLGMPRSPVCVSDVFMPVTKDMTFMVILFPKLLFQGMSSLSKDLTPMIRHSGFSLRVSETSDIASATCWPSESAVTTPEASGIFSRMYEKPVLRALPLPLLTS